ncbi:hypothetical protein D3C86_895290 [compost metagenome]
MIVNMTILKGYCIYSAAYTFKYLAPFLFVFLQRNRILFGQFRRSGHHCLFTIYPWRNQCWQTTAHIFTLLTQRSKGFCSPFCSSADLHAQIPATKAFIVAILLPNLINHITIGIYFMLKISGIPIFAAII